ncbi:mitochondrial inner membrane protease subunit 2 isoform X1 [Physeter macrocephalus]|uniref:Mitochondrial inner membrane protease subunit 2 n=2 Tax=Odontoceti TaxID=9722 RepID=A0A455BP62_PHYMC|nr:mitochondrial inner membrane protease subunit 2 isoform X1 [Physeter catodon]XP_028345665.1 mitochondrial inner membrane protease subunit 2 isoform X1 [Physeter catodon]XP_028345666.1 mitochondrial inner membrane protease subunit 2 isoform X1 [Physeter catodon]XP_054940882.1 mitochondrial inner membrane protease subunit 2 isoform X1 [Physeter catodon]|eukprot:XP_028345664.1 mitochondrial inner membrane protease subunit 2 isoform X1 [Physeter catodon]
MALSQGWVKRYFKAFCKGFFVAVPVAVTFLDQVACVARVEGASMQPSLNPGGSQSSDVVLLNHWKVRNFEVQRGDIVSLVGILAVDSVKDWSWNTRFLLCDLGSPKNPEQKIIKRVIALEGDIVKTMGHKNRYVKVPRGHIWVEGDHHGHSFDSNSFGPTVVRGDVPCCSVGHISPPDPSMACVAHQITLISCNLCFCQTHPMGQACDNRLPI